jgi:hypothetical protein
MIVYTPSRRRSPKVGVGELDQDKLTPLLRLKYPASANVANTHKALACVNETSRSTIDLLIGWAHLAPQDVLPGSRFVPLVQVVSKRSGGLECLVRSLEDATPG